MNISIKPLTKERIGDYLDFFDNRAFSDGNKIINIADVTAIQKSLAKIVPLSADAEKLCDVNCDGSISIKDATCIQCYIAKISQGAGKTGEIFS